MLIKTATDNTNRAVGGGNPEFNFKLKMVIEQARSANMPKENIEKAIKRGTGELKDGAEIQEVIF
jgi:transcriptional/translational regulatory protein YebC/TACO1